MKKTTLTTKFADTKGSLKLTWHIYAPALSFCAKVCLVAVLYHPHVIFIPRTWTNLPWEQDKTRSQPSSTSCKPTEPHGAEVRYFWSGWRPQKYVSHFQQTYPLVIGWDLRVTLDLERDFKLIETVYWTSCCVKRAVYSIRQTPRNTAVENCNPCEPLVRLNNISQVWSKAGSYAR